MQIDRCSITEDGLVNAIETCRIFEDSFDFWDECGDGWYLVNPRNPTGSGALDRFYSSIVQSLSPDVETNYNARALWKLFGFEGILIGSDTADFLLSLGSPRSSMILNKSFEGPLFFNI